MDHRFRTKAEARHAVWDRLQAERAAAFTRVTIPSP